MAAILRNDSCGPGITNSFGFCAPRVPARNDISTRADKRSEEFTAGPLQNGAANFHPNATQEGEVFSLEAPKVPRETPAQGERQALRAILMPKPYSRWEAASKYFLGRLLKVATIGTVQCKFLHCYAPHPSGFRNRLLPLGYCFLIYGSIRGDF